MCGYGQYVYHDIVYVVDPTAARLSQKLQHFKELSKDLIYADGGIICTDRSISINVNLQYKTNNNFRWIKVDVVNNPMAYA